MAEEGRKVHGQRLEVRRCPDNPILSAASSPSLGKNINGPSVIRVPDWIERPLGRYYMYFAHHVGEYIRLAYADDPRGPWTVYEPGTLRLDQVPQLEAHIASPDVHVDQDARQIRMYFHGPLKAGGKQVTMVAVSADGLHFEAGEAVIGSSYFRVFEWGGYYYAIDGPGWLNRSRLPNRDWQRRAQPLFPHVTVEDEHGHREGVAIRHSALLREQDILYIFHSRKGDAPERILVSAVRLDRDWSQWTASPPVEVMRPEMDYEGAGYKIRPSRNGPEVGVCQLRDPYVFWADGTCYLYYSVGGEMGIAVAELDADADSLPTQDGSGAVTPASSVVK